MDETTKKAIRKTILALRKLLERQDIPSVLRQYGIFPDGRRVPVEKLALLDETGKKRRTRLEAIIDREVQAVGGNQKSGVERYCREVAFTYLNRLIALRAMEVRGLLDECIKIREEYAGRSLRHHRFLKENPGIQFDTEDTESLKAFLRSVFRELQDDIKILFDPDDEYSIIMPFLQALRESIRALNEDIPEDAFKEPELIGWVYQYFQTEEKDRVFEEVRTKKKKIEGDDIIPATSLYTERYMVDYLVQNSLGAIWMEMYPDSKLCEKWPYFIKDQDLKHREPRPLKSLTFLDPASGSGHFLLVAFDILAQMYDEEALLSSEGKIPKEWVVPKEKIAITILESNLHGIDIDLRSVQLSWLVLYLKMREHQNSIGVPKLLPEKVNLVAADASLLNTPEYISWCEEKFKAEPYAINIIKGVAGRLCNLSEIGSLARPEEDLKEFIHKEKERLFSAWKKEKTTKQPLLFREMLSSEQQELPFEKITDDQFWEGVLSRVTKALDEYYRDASERGDTRAQVLVHEASRGFKFLELCNKRYDVVATNPPYMGYRNMGSTLKTFIQALYPEGGQDLYGCFIVRCGELGIKVAMVTMNSFMYLSRFKALRKKILSAQRPQTAVELGPGAFSDIGGEVVKAVLMVSDRHSDTDFTLFYNASRFDYVDKKDYLRLAVKKGQFNKIAFGPIRKIEGMPFIFRAIPKFFDWIKTFKSVGEIADCIVACKTSDNDKFVRYWWEVVRLGNRWKHYEKEAIGYRYYASPLYAIDWSKRAQEYYRNHYSSQLPNKIYLFKKSIVTSKITGPNATARILNEAALADMAVNQIFPHDGQYLEPLCALLNSNVAVYCLRVLNPTVNCQPADLSKIPLAQLLMDAKVCSELRDLYKRGVKYVITALSPDLIRLEYVKPYNLLGNSLNDLIRSTKKNNYGASQDFLQIDSSLDHLVSKELKLDPGDLEVIRAELCEPIWQQDENEDGNTDGLLPENWLGSDDIIVETYFMSLVLELLGFRWPKQVEANEPVPDWADKDGIIPITEHTDEKTILERIRDRIGAEFGEDRIADIEAEFADILYNAACKEAEIKGKTPPKKRITLAQWLEKEFFRRHTSQFKKRPIAWHLTSSNGTFQVLISCHKISLDMFKNLKNRHLAKVQSYYGTLLERTRKGESVPGGLTAGKLSDIELELEELSNRLDKLIAMPYEPLIDDGVRINIAPLQKLGLLAFPVLAAKDVDSAIADRNRWREEDKQQTTF